MANTLVYYNRSTVPAVKSDIVQARGPRTSYTTSV